MDERVLISQEAKDFAKKLKLKPDVKRALFLRSEFAKGFQGK